MDQGLETIARFENLAAAYAVRSFLEASGIPAIIFEQDVMRLDPFRPLEPLRIRLAVRAEHAELAREALAASAESGQPLEESPDALE
ncbi:MAG: hypothetical protein U0002_02435 [Thermoanaerobaculia bacterium]